MVAVRHDMSISNTITAVTFNLPCFFVDIDLEVKPPSQLNLFLKLRRSYPAVHVTYFSLVDMERVNHAGTKKPVVGSLDKFWIRTYPV